MAPDTLNEKKETLPNSPGGHTTQRIQTRPPRQITESRFRRWYLASQWTLVGVTAVGLVVALCSLHSLSSSIAVATQQAAAAATQARIAADAERPAISFGRPDGKMAEYIRPTAGSNKGAIVLYFQNGGDDVAIRTLVNAYSMNNEKRVELEPHHLLRYDFKYRGIAGRMTGGGLTVPAHSVFSFPMPDEWVPTPQQWKQIKAGHWVGGFFVAGTFEYCDKLGRYRCEGFRADYKSPPLDEFVLTTPIPCSVLPPSINEVPKPNRSEVHLLSRCEQPGENDLGLVPK